MRTILPLFLLMASFLTAGAQEIWDIQKCIDHALSNNIELALQDKTNELTELGVKQAKMNFGPNLNAQVDFTEAFGRSIDITTNTYRNENTLSNRYFLSNNIEVFSGLQKWNALKKSKLQVEGGDLNRQVIEENIQLNILTTYLTILKAKEQLAQSGIQREITQEQLDRSKALVDAGVLAENELIPLESQLANENSLAIAYENQIRTGLTSLKIILRLDPGIDIDVEVPDISAIEGFERVLDPIEDIYAYASENRPEVRGSELNEELSDYDVKIAKGAQSPTLSLFASISTNYSDQFREFGQSIDTTTIGILASDPAEAVLGFIPTTVTSEVPFFNQLKNNMSYAVGFTLAIPIFNKGTVRTGIQRAQILAEQTRLQTEQTRLNLYNTIQSAYNNAEAAIENYRAAEINLEASERTLEAEQKKLNSGVGTQVEFNVASNNRGIAASRLIEAKYDYIFNIKYLDFFQGKPIDF